MDILLQKFFEKERWEKALEVGVGKGIDKGELKKLTSPEVRLAMYDAIISGDANLAMELTTQHIANAKVYMMKGKK